MKYKVGDHVTLSPKLIAFDIKTQAINDIGKEAIVMHVNIVHEVYKIFIPSSENKTCVQEGINITWAGVEECFLEPFIPENGQLLFPFMYE